MGGVNIEGNVIYPRGVSDQLENPLYFLKLVRLAEDDLPDGRVGCKPGCHDESATRRYFSAYCGHEVRVHLSQLLAL